MIDDHTRACWVFLLKEKSEVEIVFKFFYQIVKTQFHTSIQMLRSDNGREYFKEILGCFFKEKGIIQQSYCNNSPVLWGLKEKINTF